VDLQRIVSIDNYRNINQARAAGSEIAWEQRLTQLPGILRGLGVAPTGRG